MKFESAFLVRTLQMTRSECICICPALSLKAIAPTRQESVEAMKVKLEGYVNTHGAYYIHSIGRSTDAVCCPEGFLESPGDFWTCKPDKRMCELQAWIPTSNKEMFITGCHAPGERKESIYRIVTDGVYKGAHHMPGRYLCPMCRGKHHTRYHFSWELTPPSQFVDTDNQDLRVALAKEGLGIAVVSCGLCPGCFKEVIGIAKPDLVGELETIELSFTNEPFPPSESDDSNSESKKSPRDFVAALLESPDSGACLGLALAALYGRDEYAPDIGDGLTLAGDWLGLTEEEVTDICNDPDESKCERLQQTADSVAWRIGWAVLCGGLEELLKQGWRPPE